MQFKEVGRTIIVILNRRNGVFSLAADMSLALGSHRRLSSVGARSGHSGIRSDRGEEPEWVLRDFSSCNIDLVYLCLLGTGCETLQ